MQHRREQFLIRLNRTSLDRVMKHLILIRERNINYWPTYVNISPENKNYRFVPSYEEKQAKYMVFVFRLTYCNEDFTLGLRPCRGGEACAPRWSQELFRLGLWPLVGSTMPDWSKGRDLTKDSPWPSKLEVGRGANQWLQKPLQPNNNTCLGNREMPQHSWHLDVKAILKRLSLAWHGEDRWTQS